MPMLATSAYFHPPILILSILSTLILILQVPIHCTEGTSQLFIALIHCMGGGQSLAFLIPFGVRSQSQLL